MRTSIIISIAILALGIIPGFLQQKRLGELRDEQTKLMEKALALGISLEPSDSPEAPRLTKRHRLDLEKQARKASGEILEFAREMEERRANSAMPDGAQQQRAINVLSKLADFDASQIQVFIDSLRGSPEISADTRGSLLAFAMMTLAEDHPEAAVALYAGASDLLEKNLLGEQVITSALSNWAEMSPDKAVAWIQANGERVKGVDADDIKAGVLTGVARNDPRRAFGLIDELKVEDAASAAASIMSTGHDDPEQRDAALAAMREYLAGVTDGEKRDEIGEKALEMFARTAETEGYESLTGWVEEARLTPKEREQFAAGLTWFTTKGDTGKWVEWLSANLPPEGVSDPVQELVGEWTQQDYVAAGQWLSQTPDGTAKSAAVEAYAGAVAEYEPQIAVQWAMTLPPGPVRDSTLRTIYQNWPAGDPQGAAAFARDHGLE